MAYPRHCSRCCTGQPGWTDTGEVPMEARTMSLESPFRGRATCPRPSLTKAKAGGRSPYDVTLWTRHEPCSMVLEGYLGHRQVRPVFCLLPLVKCMPKALFFPFVNVHICICMPLHVCTCVCKAEDKLVCCSSGTIPLVF